MRLPQGTPFVREWNEIAIAEWRELVQQSETLNATALRSDRFEATCEHLKNLVKRREASSLRDILKSRKAARALTWLWVSDTDFRRLALTEPMLKLLVAKQQPRLSRLTLSQLGQVFFNEYDGLSEPVFQQLKTILPKQAQLIPGVSRPEFPDPISAFRSEAWLFDENGYVRVATGARQRGTELENEFERLGISSLGEGRFASLCRACYYLDALREIPLGHYDPVMDELRKPRVHDAPYEKKQLIGHAALEILIDRVEGEPSEVWQKFILDIAGDPRVSEKSNNYMKWWRPLGDERTGKVRSWLSREDLHLFLTAVEQYGESTGKEDLKRMFPARKRFLEGLYTEGWIKQTRLMLGRQAEYSVTRHIKGDIHIGYASLGAGMHDKAVICVDCGKFQLVEGSHSFKIWVYLDTPGELIWNYSKHQFNHGELTHKVPTQYSRMHPGLPYTDITHSANWQHKVVNFLRRHEIELDLAALMPACDGRAAYRRHGVPVVARPPTKPPAHTWNPDGRATTEQSLGSGSHASSEPAPSGPSVTDHSSLVGRESSIPAGKVPQTREWVAKSLESLQRKNPKRPQGKMKTGWGETESGSRFSERMEAIEKHEESRAAALPIAVENDESKQAARADDNERKPVPPSGQSTAGVLTDTSRSGARSENRVDIYNANLRKARDDMRAKEARSPQGPEIAQVEEIWQQLAPIEQEVLRDLLGHPTARAVEVALRCNLPKTQVNRILYGAVSGLVFCDSDFRWSVLEKYRGLLEPLSAPASYKPSKGTTEQSAETSEALPSNEADSRIWRRFSDLERDILHYLIDSPNAKVHGIARECSASEKMVKSRLIGPLFRYVSNDSNDTWSISPDYIDRLKGNSPWDR